MRNLNNKKIQLIILILLIGLIGGYFYYDYQRYQGLREEVANLRTETSASQNQTVDLSKSLLKKELKPGAELIQVIGKIKKIEDGVIVLEGKMFSLEEKATINFDDFDDPNNKEYRLTVSSETKINQRNQNQEIEEIKPENLKEGRAVSVMGKVDSFGSQEVAAEAIFVLR